jgi:NAD(P)-dependent dehydrogenase (short-subunit alcohol dehydrogenase family)
LEQAITDIRSEAPADAVVLAIETDVSGRSALERLDREVVDRLGDADILMNNAAIQAPSTAACQADD